MSEIDIGVSEENLCASGDGCCCHDVKLCLTAPEWEFLEAGGADFEEILPVVASKAQKARELRLEITRDLSKLDDPKIINQLAALTIVKDGQGMVQMKGDCGYLDRSGDFPMCTVYDDPERPDACAAFPPGNLKCMEFRKHDGIIDEYVWTEVDMPQIKPRQVEVQ